MNNSQESFSDSLFKGIARVFSPLQWMDAVTLIQNLGWELPEADAFESVIDSVKDLPQKINDFTAAESSFDKAEALLSLIQQIRNVIETINQFRDHIVSAYSSAPEMDKLATRLLDYLIVQYLQTYRPKTYSLFVLFTIIENEEKKVFNALTGDELEESFILHSIHWDRLPQIMLNPQKIAKEYDWGDDDHDFDGDKLIERIGLVLSAFYLPGGIYEQNETIKDKLGRSDEDTTELRIPLVQGGEWPDSYIEVGLSIAPDNNNLLLYPYLLGDHLLDLEIFPKWYLSLPDVDTINNIKHGLGLVISPPHHLVFKDNLFSDDRVTHHNLEFTISQKAADVTEFLLFGSPGATRLGVTGISLTISTSDSKEFGIALGAEKVNFVITSGDGDGFLQQVLPADPVGIRFSNFALGISSTKGFYIQGGSGLEYNFQVNKSFGPIFINTFDLLLITDDSITTLITGVSGSATIGPVTAVVQEIGLEAILDTGKPGILGNADFSLGFKPPSAIGLSIDAEGIKGGGYLEIDKPNYAGSFNLTFQDTIEITVFGLLTTELPDGKSGYSLVLSILAQFSPIQIGFGFTLVGVGGLIGINRSMQEEVLREKYKSHSLDHILFPENPIRDAAMLIGTLQSVFPPHPSYHVFGLMGKIVWGGSLNLIQFQFGIIIEIGGPKRVTILGQAQAILPNPISPILILHMDMLGIINFFDETLAIDSTLYDSKLMEFKLSGDMALRTSWGDNPDFALSIGGFHPRYNPPPGFPSLQRLMISLKKGKARIEFTGYLAITSNSFQTGAKLEIVAKLGSFSVNGGAGFDALIQFSPFYFDVAFYAWCRLKWKKKTLSSIDLYLNLTGPNPYHAIGHAKIKICWCLSVKLNFDKTFGDRITDEKPQVSPFEMIWKHIEDPRSLRYELPTWASSNIKLVDAHIAEERLDPLGAIVLSQNAVPIDLMLDRFGGGTPPKNEKYLTLSVKDHVDSLEKVQTNFSPAQFRNWSDTKKLSAPPFEKFNAGIRLFSKFLDPSMEIMEDSFETVLVEKDNQYSLADPRAYQIRNCGMGISAALGKSRLLQGGRLRFQPGRTTRNPNHAKYIRMQAPLFTLTGQDATNGLFNRVEVDGKQVGDLTYTEALDLAQENGQPDVMVRSVEAANNVNGVEGTNVTVAPSVTSDNKKLTFLSNYRRNFPVTVTNLEGASQLTGELTISLNGHAGANAQAGRSEPITHKIAFLGPGDVAGINANVIGRLEPPPGANDFEPGYFPFIEFRDPDFLWRYSLDAPDPTINMQPWLNLIVLSTEELKNIQTNGSAIKRDQSGWEFLHISWEEDTAGLFPPTDTNWEWATAHTQVDSFTETEKQDIHLYIKTFPDRHCSRLLCFRKLEPTTSYVAFLVPYYKAGCQSGQQNGAGPGIEPALSANYGEEIVIPIYYRWSFMTSEKGDFESLVRELKPKPAPKNTGVRAVDTTLNFLPNIKKEEDIADCFFKREGALAVPNFSSVRKSYDEQLFFQNQEKTEKIFSQLNADLKYGPKRKPSEEEDGSDPLITMPVYGRFYNNPGLLKLPYIKLHPRFPEPLARAHQLIWRRKPPSWIEELNLDFRNRIAAGLGTRVVQGNQEDYAKRCWYQVGEIRLANEKLRQTQAGLKLANQLKAKHLDPLSDERFTLMTAPFHAHFATNDTGKGVSLKKFLETSGLSKGVVRPIFKRIAQQRIGLDRVDLFEPWRIEYLYEKYGETDWYRRCCKLVQEGETDECKTILKEEAPEGVEIRPGDILCKRDLKPNGDFTLADRVQVDFDGLTIPAIPGLPGETPPDILPPKTEIIPVTPMNIDRDFRPKFDVDKVLRGKAERSIQFNDGRTIPDDFDPIMDVPELADAMYRPLKKLSLDYILPGLDKVPNNSITLCEENRRFIESYMVGINHEMGRELVWRKFPMDQRGTVFSHFWDPTCPVKDEEGDNGHPIAQRDIENIHQWKNKLGEHSVDGEYLIDTGDPDTDTDESKSGARVALVIKGDLIRRYPDIIFFALKQIVKVPGDAEEIKWEKEDEILPSFRGQLGPDVLAVGFPFTTDDLRSGNYYFVLQENRKLPRFGLDINTRSQRNGDDPGDGGDLSWNNVNINRKGYIQDWDPPESSSALILDNSAQIAKNTLQKPIQLIIHSSQMMKENPDEH